MRVLVVRCGALGDLVYATSVIDALKYQFGKDTVIDFVCTPGSGTLFKDDNRVNRVFSLKHKKIPLIFSKEKQKIIKASKENQYDILINFEYGKQFQSLLNNIKAKQKIGATYNKISITQKINRAQEIKAYLTNIIDTSNLDKAYPNITTIDFKPIKQKFQLETNYIVVSPSNSHIFRSGINYRAWENTKWIELIQKLSEKIQVVIVGAKGEESFFKQLQPYPPNTIDLVGKNNLSELATILKSAQLTICTDSAIGHMSAAVNSKVIVLMGPNDPITDAPYQTPDNKVIPITLNLECSPCYKTKIMRQCTNNICMKNITTAMVMENLKPYIDLR